jgi:hypothetical protein
VAVPAPDAEATNPGRARHALAACGGSALPPEQASLQNSKAAALQRTAGVLLLHPPSRSPAALVELAARRPGRRCPPQAWSQLVGHDLDGRAGAAVLGRPGPLLEPTHDHHSAALGQRLRGVLAIWKRGARLELAQFGN